LNIIRLLNAKARLDKKYRVNICGKKEYTKATITRNKLKWPNENPPKILCWKILPWAVFQTSWFSVASSSHSKENKELYLAIFKLKNIVT
jgi:hypothetical protein